MPLSTLGQLGPQRRPHVGPSSPDLCATSLAGDNDEREVTVAARQERLTDTTCHKLFELAVSGGRMLIHEHLLQRVEAPTLVPTVMERQRRKLGDYASNPSYDLYQPPVGYRKARAETRERSTK